MRRLTTALGVVALAAALTGCSRTQNSNPEVAGSVANDSSLRVAGLGAERSVTLEVGGMICQDCADKVQASLARVEGVRTATVQLDERVAIVVADPSVADTALTGAVRRAGPGYLGLVRH